MNDRRPLLALSEARIKQFLREPGSLFWAREAQSRPRPANDHEPSSASSTAATTEPWLVTPNVTRANTNSTSICSGTKMRPDIRNDSR